MKNIFLPLLFFGSVLCSCDCVFEVRGTVVDSVTRQPLNGVRVIGEERPDTSYTESSGMFFRKGVSGGLFGCPPRHFILEKEGYKTVRRKIGNGKTKVILLKAKP
jgi:hypothetical protein